MAEPQKGLFYSPSPPPQSGDFEALRAWCVREYDRIASNLKEGRAQFLRVDELGQVPDKLYAGLVCYFSTGVVSAGSAEGLYEYRNDSAWHKL